MNRRDIQFVALLWSAFLIRGCFYAAILPMWEGYDEPFHFAYIQHLVATHTSPTLAMPVSRQVDASLHVLPLPYMLKYQAIPKPLYAHDDFWRLPAEEREFLRRKFEDIPSEWGREPSLERVQNYEAQQPPLYYVLSWPLLILLGNASLEVQVFTLRFAGLAFASLAVPLAYAMIRQITGTRTVAFSIVGLATVMPELYINLARLSNEVPAIVLYTALLYALVRFLEEPANLIMLPVSGALIGLGLLTKAYFVTSIPPLLVIIVIAFWRWPQQRRRLVLYSFITAFLIAALAGPWYFHVHQLTGSWSGLKRETIAPHSLLQTVASIPKVNWLSGLRSVIISHIWFGGWSFLKVGHRWYLALGGLDLAAAAGIGVLCWRIKKGSPTAADGISPNSLVVMTCMYGFFCLGLAYDVLLTYVSVGVSSSTGWYMYCLVAAEATLLHLGLRTLLPRNIFRVAIALLTTAYGLLDLYGTHFLLMPYYTGLIAHDAFEQVRPAKLTNLVHFGARELMQRLTMNKPAALSRTVLLVMWLLYLVATICIVLLSGWAAFQHDSTLQADAGC